MLDSYLHVHGSSERNVAHDQFFKGGKFKVSLCKGRFRGILPIARRDKLAGGKTAVNNCHRKTVRRLFLYR